MFLPKISLMAPASGKKVVPILFLDAVSAFQKCGF